ncbi:MAG: ATP synthase F1 subunit gamma [Saprospiraceae bacterium]|nr:ATP synthase F1 subunit gamma [Saprospiraceae bacterium]
MAANLKEVRERIKSIKSTQQITKAMKMVSAAKLRKAQDSIVRIRPYANKLNEILAHVLSNMEGDPSGSLGVAREVKKVLIVVVTSNRGLCGAFNSNVIKKAVALCEQKYATQFNGGDIDFLCIGKKGRDFFRKRFKERVNDNYVDLFSDLSFDHVVEVPNMAMDAFIQETYDAIEVCFGRFKNAGVQYAEATQYLPVPKMKVEKDDKKTRADYIFEPDQQSLLETLIPTILQTQFHRFLLDTHASEHGARMTAMDMATDNAEELLRDLRISYNKARQEAITSEISEIVGGAAALGG